MQSKLKPKEHYLSLKWDFNILYSEENKEYTLYLQNNDLEFSAETPEQLIKMFPEKLDEWLDTKINSKNKNNNISEPVKLDACNGRLSLNVSSSIHYNLLKDAQREGITINHLINNILNCHYGKFKVNKKSVDAFMPQRTLTVVNCSKTFDEVKELKMYACGTSGIAYTFKEFKYFGMYKDKNVSRIYEVLAVVDIEPTENIEKATGKVYWKNVDEDDEVLIKEIINRLNNKNTLKLKELTKERKNQIKDFENRIFLLHETNFAETNFTKDSHGGMYGVKKYFNNIALGCKDVHELAQKLYDKKWSEFEKEDSTEE